MRHFKNTATGRGKRNNSFYEGDSCFGENRFFEVAGNQFCDININIFKQFFS